MNESVIIGGIAGVVGSICALATVVIPQHFRHKEAMRKQAAEDREAEHKRMLEDRLDEERRKKDDHERELARAALQKRFNMLEARQVTLDNHLQTNTFKLEELVQVARSTKPADLEGGK